MAQQKQTKAKPKAEAASGKAVTPYRAQALQALPERLAELQAQKHYIEMVEGIYALLMVEGIDYINPLGTSGKPIFPKPMLTKNGVSLLRLYLDLQFASPNVEDGCDFSIREQPIIRYRIRTDIYDRQGRLLGSGLGMCSSMEAKYRYRWLTSQQLPADMKVGFTKLFKKTDPKTGEVREVESIDQEKWIAAHGVGSARWTKFGIQVRVDNPDVYDQENTILSQAKKRSEADGTKLVTGAGRIFLIGREADQAVSKVTETRVDTEEVAEGEFKEVETAEEQAEEQAEEYNVYRETLKDMMVKAGFTTPDGQLDLIRFKKLLQEQYKVNNVNLLDEAGRKKLLNQMADFVAVAGEGNQKPL